MALILKDSKTFAALHVQEWFSFTARSGIINFVVEHGKLDVLPGRSWGSLGRQNVLPQLEFPQDTESNCDAVRECERIFHKLFWLCFFSSEIFEKGHGQKTIRETLKWPCYCISVELLCFTAIAALPRWLLLVSICSLRKSKDRKQKL